MMQSGTNAWLGMCRFIDAVNNLRTELLLLKPSSERFGRQLTTILIINLDLGQVAQ